MSDDRDELAELRDLHRRIGGGPEELEMPPPGSWDRIAAAVGLDDTDTETDSDSDSKTTTTVVALPRRVPSAVWIIGAAAAAVLVVVGLLAVIGGEPDSTVVASSTLERLAGDTATGSAELVDTDGTMRLQLDTDGLDPADGFVEVWMIDTGVTQLVSLGPLRADGIYELPAGMDAAAFPVVDVSFEPLDGNPAHSGDSVLRGQLEF